MSVVTAVGGYDEWLLLNEDTDFQLRVTEVCEMLPVPAAVYYYRIGRPDQVTRDHAKYVVAYQRFLSKHAEILAGMPRARFDLIRQVLHNCIRGGLWGQALRYRGQLLPSAPSMPLVFLRYQKAAALEVASKLRQSVGPSGRTLRSES